MWRLHVTKRHYVYGDIEESGFTESDTQIAFKDWTVDDMAQITSNLLEDVNKHSECNNPQLIASLMKTVGIDEMQMALFMKGYMKHMFQTYGY